jgi:hypothetical protein
MAGLKAEGVANVLGDGGLAFAGEGGFHEQPPVLPI